MFLWLYENKVFELDFFSMYGITFLKIYFTTPVKILYKLFRIHIMWLFCEIFGLNGWLLNGFLPAHGKPGHQGQWLLSSRARFLAMQILVVVFCELLWVHWPDVFQKQFTISVSFHTLFYIQ